MKKLLFLVLGMTLSCFSAEPQKLTSTNQDNALIKKIKDLQSHELQALKNFTPGFKAALKDFFSFDWKSARKNANKKETRNEVEKLTKRLQQDYKNLQTEQLMTKIKELVGSGTNFLKVDKETKQHMFDLLDELVEAEKELYSAVTSFESKVEAILSGLLEFSALNPAPYTVWSTIKKDVVLQHTIFSQFAEVVKPILQDKDNAQITQKYFQKVDGTVNKLSVDYADLKKVLNELFSQLAQGSRTSELVNRVNRLASLDAQLEEVINSLIKDLKPLALYAPFITDKQTLKQWQALVSNLQKLLQEIIKNAVQDRNRFEQIVSRHRTAYEFVAQNNYRQRIEQSLGIDGKAIQELSELLQQVQPALV